ncbi:hypothetical protein OHR68_00775 [Spirillospora sp. NBC_00431]
MWKPLNEFDLPDHLRRYAELVEGTGQLIPFLATLAELKPAMDDWVPAENWPSFAALLDELDLVWSIDAAFEFITEPDVPESIVGGRRLNTTRAFGYPAGRAAPGQRLHVFISRDRERLRRAAANGWYPLVIGDRVVEKPWIDHYRFGAALGFPDCCRRFFAAHNDWWRDNSLYQAWRRTKQPNFLANTLLKYTGFSYAAYLPCAFDCAATVAYADRVRDLVYQSSPRLGSYTDELLRRPYLVLSEWEIAGFDKAAPTADGLTYEEVMFVPTDRPDYRLYRLLRAGNRLAVRDDVLVVFRDDQAVGGYQVDGLRFGPQLPVLVQFDQRSGQPS